MTKWGGSARRILSVFAVLLLVGVAGCGDSAPKPQPVSGKVTIKGKGPLAKGTIRFTNSATKVSAVGQLDSSGAYKLSSLAQNDGALAGDYTVTFSATETGRDYDHPNDPEIKMIDSKYGTDETTDLKFTVKAGANVANFEVDPAP